MSSEPFMSVRDAVMEIRGDVKALAEKLDHIDRVGSIGTKAELGDHESRLRQLETTRMLLRGGWAALALSVSFLAGVSGLALSVAHFLG